MMNKISTESIYEHDWLSSPESFHSNDACYSDLISFIVRFSLGQEITVSTNLICHRFQFVSFPRRWTLTFQLKSFVRVSLSLRTDSQRVSIDPISRHERLTSCVSLLLGAFGRRRTFPPLNSRLRFMSIECFIVTKIIIIIFLFHDRQIIEFTIDRTIFYHYWQEHLKTDKIYCCF